MLTVSITRTSSSRATIAAGTRPPRVMATIALKGPAEASRQASARASRWNWSHETGKALSRGAVMGELGWGEDRYPHSKRAGDVRAASGSDQQLSLCASPDAPQRS